MPRFVASSARWRKTAGGAPRIHAELTKLGFIISEITVSRYLPRRPVEPDQLKRWMAFLRNHKDDIAAMDLFTVPATSLRLLYGFFVIEHGRRHIVHFNATFHPTSAWVGLIQFRGHFLKGGYDVHNGKDNAAPATPPGV